MKDEHLDMVIFIIFIILVIITAIAIISSVNDASAQEVMLDCMNSAIRTNRSLSVEEAAKICWRG